MVENTLPGPDDRPWPAPAAGEHAPKRWRVGVLAAVALAGVVAGCWAVRGLTGRNQPGPTAPWWAGCWRSADETPALDLVVRQGAITGQLILPHSDEYLRSLAVLGGEARGDVVLLVVEPVREVKEAQSAKRPGSARYERYLLVRQGPDQAALYRLNEAPGDVRIRRPAGPAAQPVLYPRLDDLGRHVLVGQMTNRSAGGGWP